MHRICARTSACGHGIETAQQLGKMHVDSSISQKIPVVLKHGSLRF
jgi:hypothetical protein